MIKLIEKDGSVRFEVHAKPRAKKSRIVGIRGVPTGRDGLSGGDDDCLEVALAAPPVDGAANEELVGFLAKALGVPRRDVEILRGETSQRKLIAVRGLLPQALGGCAHEAAPSLQMMPPDEPDARPADA